MSSDALRELVGNLERFFNGDTEIEKIHGMKMFIETSVIRKVAEAWEKDPVELLDSDSVPVSDQQIQ